MPESLVPSDPLHAVEELQSPQDLFPLLPHAVAVADARGVIVQVNREMEALFGCDREDLLGMRVELLIPESAEVPREYSSGGHDSALLHARPDGWREFALRTRSGERIYVEGSLTPVRCGGERLNLILLRDITDKVVSQRMLIRITRRTFAKTDRDFLTSLARELASELQAAYITVGRLCNQGASVETIAFLDRGRLVDNLTYPLAGTPCDTTVKDSFCLVTSALQEKYPDDELLATLKLHAYVGVRLHDSSGNVCGLINVLYEEPISPRLAEQCLSLLEIVALRASPELERLQTEHLVRKLSLSVDRSPIAVMITDSEGVIEYVNPKFCDMSGFAREECLGARPSISASGKTPRKVYEQMWEALLAGHEWQGDLLNRRKDDSLYWARTRIFPISDGTRRVTNFVSIQEDVSGARQLTRQLEYEATHDQLTDLINRREFERRLELAVQSARGDGSVHCLCFLDLDQFKVLNDSSGHVAGDALLKQIGAILKREVRANDTAARVGGDEFGLLLMNCPSAKAAEIAHKIRRAIGELNFQWNGQVHALGASIGITEITGGISDAVELMKQVDAACYTAKEQGRNRVHVYQEDNESIFRHRRAIDWIPRINAALSEDRFELFVQPIVPVRRTAGQPVPVSYEVLVRLVDTDERLVPPAQFLPAVERYGLAGRLDRHVVGKVVRWLGDNPDVVEEVQGFAINLSGASIADPELLDYLITTLEAGGVPAHKIRFELTETSAISNLPEASRFMNRLREAGCQIVLDDFGSGLSSFTYLKNLPVDILKIDGLLVKGVANDEAGFIMVKMINELAHSLGIRTVAEYVENESILSCLEGLGVDYAQGYVIDPPAQIDDVFGNLRGMA